MEQYVIEMEHITKEFGSFKANDDITLKLKKGGRKRCRKVHPDECTVRAVPAGAGNDQDERKACDNQ